MYLQYNLDLYLESWRALAKVYSISITSDTSHKTTTDTNLKSVYRTKAVS